MGINTDEAGALGAVYQAAHLSKGFKVKPFIIKDATLFPIQVRSSGICLVWTWKQKEWPSMFNSLRPIGIKHLVSIGSGKSFAPVGCQANT